MTPAERLAKQKRRQRPKRNGPPAPQPVAWATTLRDRREALGLSMRDVAAACGLGVPSYFRVEHGYADPCLSTALRISRFFGCGVWELWTKYESKGGGS